MTATIVMGAVLLAAPVSGAVDAPATPEAVELENPQVEQTPQPAGQMEVASVDVVNQVRGQLAAFGVQAPAVDTALTDAVDQAIVDHVPNTKLRESDETAEDNSAPVTGTQYVDQVEITDEMRGRFVEEDAVPLDPNYRWHNDPVAKTMAGKPFDEWVLHRVSGSWFDAPRIPEESMVVQNQDASLYGPGTPIYLGDSMMCTLGVVGTDAQGRKVGLTAGHCGQPGDQVWSADSWQVGPTGTVVTTNQVHDYSVVELGSNAELTRTYNGVTVNSVGGPVGPGQVLCKQGVATGHTCGHVWAADEEVHITQVCAMTGDSGAPLLAGDRMVGMISGGVLPDHRLSCKSPLQGQLFMPTASHTMDAVLKDVDARGGVGAGFRLPD
nr:S1 family peptidase [Corynebacterium hylobatis]